MDETPQPSVITLTDPKPLPRDPRCSVCRAPESKRIALSPFGRVGSVQACGVCGHEDKDES